MRANFSPLIVATLAVSCLPNVLAASHLRRLDINTTLSDYDGSHSVNGTGNSTISFPDDIVIEAAVDAETPRCLPTLDFDTDGTGNPNQAGDLATDLWSAQGITISSSGSDGNLPPMLFDSENPTGGDWDLTTENQGLVLILSEDGDALDPDDNARGGTFLFEFANPQTLRAIGLLDVEEAYEIRFVNPAGEVVHQVTRLPNQMGDGQLKREDFDNEDDANTKDVARLEIQMFGSGAVTYLEFACDDEEDYVDTSTSTSTGIAVDKTFTVFDGE